MAQKHVPTKHFFVNRVYVFRFAAVLLMVASIGLTLAYVHVCKISDAYAMQIVGGVSNASSMYIAAKADARCLGAFLAGTLTLGFALMLAAFFYDRKMLCIENARMLEEKWRLEACEERYRLIEQDSGVIILEVSRANKTVIANETFVQFFCKEPQFDCFMQAALVHPEDRHIFYALLSEVDSARRSAQRELRVQDAHGNYIWFSAIMSGLTDTDGKNTRIIAKFTNIDAQKRRMELLELQAQTDLLTGLYNKTVTEEIISRLLLDDPDSVHALLVLDLDDLKGINDKCGHVEGDRAIKEITSLIRRHFRSSDVAGRIGGDEFMVFLRDIKDGVQLNAMVSALVRRLGRIVVGEDGSCRLSVSIGAVLTSPDAQEGFQSLYKRADAALYHVKRKGKNGFALYAEGMELKGHST